jgi:hypothetical protein
MTIHRLKFTCDFETTKRDSNEDFICVVPKGNIHAYFNTVPDEDHFYLYNSTDKDLKDICGAILNELEDEKMIKNYLGMNILKTDDNGQKYIEFEDLKNVEITMY